MATDTTKEEREFIIDELAKPQMHCPRCGKDLIVIPLNNDARKIRCVDDDCITWSIRGL